jgi:hypothetical protein
MPLLVPGGFGADANLCGVPGRSSRAGDCAGTSAIVAYRPGPAALGSAYSKVPDAAADLVQYLSSAELQKKRAIAFSVLPTLPALYSDPDVLAKTLFLRSR